MSTISDLSPEAFNDFRELYDKHPNAVKSLTDYPGDIGRLAKICIECGGETA